MSDDRMIGFLTETFDLFRDFTGRRPTRVILPLAMYHRLVKELLQRTPNSRGDGLAAVFEFEGCQVSLCNSGIWRYVGGEKEQGTGIGAPIERVNEELKIS